MDIIIIYAIFVLIVIGIIISNNQITSAGEPPNAHTPEDNETQFDIVTVPKDTVSTPSPPPIPIPPPPKSRPSFEIAHAPVAEIEGGYQNHPADRGNYNRRGELVGTNWGIAAFVAEEYFNRTVTAEDMRTLKKSVALEIYRRKFWEPLRASEFPTQALANIVYDGFVNHGKWGIRLLQRVLGVVEDGIVGPITLASIHAVGPEELYRAYYDARHAFYHAIVRNRPDQRVFLRGWMRRLEHYAYERAAK